ncbi:MAG TPA: hypothetical protein VFB41_04060 [Solirubrobacteraceae bacterium]|nr:hypothetical protein [Solirubrobacteraceae bacterium]
MLAEIALIAAVVFAVNLLPAFGPPTWIVLVALRLTLDAPAATLVLTGAAAAASGRLCLAMAAGSLRGHLSARRRDGLDALGAELRRRPAGAVAALALFALSPVPSAQLFVAAGLVRARLVPLTAAFFAGRLVSYALYLAAADVARRHLASALVQGLRSPWAIALQIGMLAGLVVLVRVDWVAVLARHGWSGERGVAPRGPADVVH